MAWTDGLPVWAKHHRKSMDRELMCLGDMDKGQKVTGEDSRSTFRHSLWLLRKESAFPAFPNSFGRSRIRVVPCSGSCLHFCTRYPINSFKKVPMKVAIRRHLPTHASVLPRPQLLLAAMPSRPLAEGADESDVSSSPSGTCGYECHGMWAGLLLFRKFIASVLSAAVQFVVVPREFLLTGLLVDGCSIPQIFIKFAGHCKTL